MATETEDSSPKGGELLFCGGTLWEGMGKKQLDFSATNLISPTRLRPLMGVNICFVAAGCVSNHCVALDVDGRCYTWGRNEKGQLGHGDLIQRDRPTIVSALSKCKIVKTGAGRSHTVVVTDDENSFAFGWNKHGQLGSGAVKNEMEKLPVRCLVSGAKNAVCGADFTVWISAIQGSSILTAGLPQYGQLGHGTDNEYNAKDSSVKLVYEPQPRPRPIASLSGKTICKVACGSNHTVAVDTDGFIYTWGYGGYGRLGHKEQKDEWTPRALEIFQRNNVLPPTAVVAAGSAHSACTAGGGQLYMWGKVKQSSECWMYPKPVFDLSGWALRCMDSGNTINVCGADDSCISWGLSQYGELGYGPLGPKSSANPKKIDILDGMHVLSVACGFGHSLIVVDRTNVGDRIEKLDVYDGKNPSEEGTTENHQDISNKKESADKPGKKRKRGSDNATVEVSAKSDRGPRKRVSKKKDLSDTENSNGDNDEDSEDEANGSLKSSGKGKNSSHGRGRNRGAVASARGKATSETGDQKKKTPAKGRGKGRGGRAGKSKKEIQGF